jgi:hypothetical protein
VTELLSICIPTHDGRAAVLSQLIDDVGRELRERPPRRDVEICVSDNASADGTREVVAEAAGRLPCAVRYRRSEHDLGFVSNFVAAIEMARGAHCWTLGSDDLLAEGALRVVDRALERIPDAAGYVFPAVDVSAEAPELRTIQPARALFPLEQRETVYQGFDAVVDGVGNAWCGLSWNVLAREPLARLAATDADRLAAHPSWPQVLLFAALAAERPCWAWCPDGMVVRRRQADAFLFEGAEVATIDRSAELVDGLSAAWADVLGGRGPRWRRRMGALRAFWGRPEDALAAKLYDRPSLVSQLRLAVGWTRAFGRTPGFVKDLLPALLLPGRAVRALHHYKRGVLGRRTLPVAGRDRVDLTASLPDRLQAGAVGHVRVTVANRTTGSLPAFGPRMVCVEQRWRLAGAAPLEPAARGIDAAGAFPTPLHVPVGRGRQVERWLALLPPSEPGEYVLEVAPYVLGIGPLDAAGVSEALVGHVSVVEPDG